MDQSNPKGCRLSKLNLFYSKLFFPPLLEEIWKRLFLDKPAKDGTVFSIICIWFQTKEGADPEDAMLGTGRHRMFSSSPEPSSPVAARNDINSNEPGIGEETGLVKSLVVVACAQKIYIYIYFFCIVRWMMRLVDKDEGMGHGVGQCKWVWNKKKGRNFTWA